MLRSRNLDDQSFEQIMEFVLGRLPWFCPSWTNHNESDPGITILELMAWYKEMQQYHLNSVTDEMRFKLLKLLGVAPASPQPAECLVQMPREADKYLPYERLYSPQDIAFELDENACGGEKVEAVYLISHGAALDMTETIAQPGISIWPFEHEGAPSELLIGFTGRLSSIRLWFEVDDAREVARNPFSDSNQSPRELSWSTAEGSLTVADETHGLSHSGFVTLTAEGGFTENDGGLSLPVRCYIRVREMYAGCEERVRLSGIGAGRYRAVQRETLARYDRFTVEPGDAVSLPLNDALSRQGEVVVYVRNSTGWRFAQSYVRQDEAGAFALDVSAADACMDGEPNILAVSLDPIRCTELIFPSTGLPGMELELSLGGRRVLTDDLTLLCDTRYADGVVRPALWHYVEDLSSCGPKSLAFTYDTLREQIIFGDGAHGAVVPRSERGVLAASLTLSWCGGGNLPADSGLSFADGTQVGNTAAEGGADGQSVSGAAQAFLRELEHPGKCATAADFERAAMLTPGLRVASAKAIPGFDPDEPSGVSRIPIITVVALPYSDLPRQMPDARFLKAVRAHLETKRPICTKVKVIAPCYVEIGLSALVSASRDVTVDIREEIVRYLRVDGERGIGEAVVRDELLVRLMRIEGMLLVERLELRSMDPDCRVGQNGDLIFKSNAIACLGALNVQLR